MPEHDAPRPDLSLRARFVHGIAWQGSARVLAQLISWLATLVVLRYLTPAEYGTMGLVMVYMLYVEAAAELGLRPALVQRERVEPVDYASVFQLGLAVSLLLGLATVGLAPLIASLFHDPQAETVLAVAAAGIPLSAAAVAPVAALERRLDFRSLSLIDLTAAVLSAGVVLYLGVTGFGVWALVVGWLLQRLLRTAGACLWARVGLVGRPSLQRLNPLTRFGAWVTADRLLWNLYFSADSLIIGSLLGPSALGTYTTARTVSTLPVRRVVPIVNAVSLPIFSRLSRDKERLSRYVMQLTRALVMIAAPSLVGLALVAPDAIPLLLTSRWSVAVGPVQVLAIVTLFRLLASVLVPPFQAIGRPDVNTRITLASAIAFPVAFLVSTQATGGLVGVLAVLLIGQPLVLLVRVILLRRLLGFSGREYLRSLAPAALAVTFMGLAVGSVGWLAEDWLPWVRLAGMVVTGIGSYLAFIVLAFPRVTREVRLVLREARA